MNYVNREKLRRELFAKDVSVTDLAKKLGITRQSFYIKLKGKRDFREDEIVVLGEIFGKGIFFDKKRCQKGNSGKENL